MNNVANFKDLSNTELEELVTVKTMRMSPDYSLSGWIYVLKNKFFSDNVYKVGMTTRTPEERVKELSSTGVPCDFDIVLAYASNNPKEDEFLIHADLNEYRVNASREFFQCNIDIITDVISQLGLIERSDFIENIAVTNELIGIGSSEDYIDSTLFQSGLSCFGNLDSIKNYIFSVGLSAVMNEIKKTGNSLVTTDFGAFFVRDVVSQMEDKRALEGGLQ